MKKSIDIKNDINSTELYSKLQKKDQTEKSSLFLDKFCEFFLINTPH